PVAPARVGALDELAVLHRIADAGGATGAAIVGDAGLGRAARPGERDDPLVAGQVAQGVDRHAGSVTYLRPAAEYSAVGSDVGIRGSALANDSASDGNVPPRTSVTYWPTASLIVAPSAANRRTNRGLKLSSMPSMS